ncbi:MAG TPA: hypothetical protein DER07_07865 [Armatimonadetes bacterium]|nr:hypothetical protein [Armatimonadota bacterium]
MVALEDSLMIRTCDEPALAADPALEDLDVGRGLDIGSPAEYDWPEAGGSISQFLTCITSTRIRGIQRIGNENAARMYSTRQHPHPL